MIVIKANTSPVVTCELSSLHCSDGTIDGRYYIFIPEGPGWKIVERVRGGRENGGLTKEGFIFRSEGQRHSEQKIKSAVAVPSTETGTAFTGTFPVPVP